MRIHDADIDAVEIEFYGGPFDGERLGAAHPSPAIVYASAGEDVRYNLVACADGSLRYVFAPMIETFAR